ncbi:hypothetical protein V1517DRAFT_346756 [Lipomyces orientalis]|uniref:Uncharacterized protein n=1 Tax=Lipomyces orientalis TaxID=1233043 RepID=A0ACC3TMK5_9ASCO
MMGRYLYSTLPASKKRRVRVGGPTAAPTETWTSSQANNDSRLASSNSTFTTTNSRLRLTRFSRSTCSSGAAMVSYLSSAQMRPRPPPPAPAQSSDADPGLHHLRLPPIEPLPPLIIPTPFLPSSESAPPAIPARVRPPLSAVSLPDDDYPDWKMLVSRRHYSSGSISGQRPPSVSDSLSSGIRTGSGPSENFTGITALTPKRQRNSSTTSASPSLASNSSPSSSPLPSPSSVGEPPLTSSSPISDSSSTASGSSAGYYFYTGNASKKHRHRRNLAVLKNSISANYTPLEVLPPRASMRRSYLNTSMESIQSIQRPLEKVSCEDPREVNGIDETDLRRATTAGSNTARQSEDQEKESNSQPQREVRHVKSKSIKLHLPLRHHRGKSQTNVPNIPANAPPPTVGATSTSSRTFSRLGLHLSRMSRSSPDLRSQYLNNTVLVVQREEDTIPLPDIPVRPATSGSAASTSGSSTSSVTRLHTLKSHRSLPRLKTFARKPGTSATNATVGLGGTLRSISPLQRFGMDAGISSRNNTIAVVPPLPEKFLHQTDFEDVGISVEGDVAGTGDQYASASSDDSPGLHTPETPITPTSTMEPLASPLSDETVVAGETVTDDSQLSAPVEPVRKDDPETFYTPRSTMILPTSRPGSAVSVPQEKRASSATTPLDRATTASTVDTITDSEMKRQWKRVRLIRELIDTEIAYLSDLIVIEKYYRATAVRQPFITKDDVLTIFANFDGILAFTHQFCISLRSAGASAMRDEKGQENEVEDLGVLDEQESFVGETFLQAIPQLEKVYKIYCHSHETSIRRLHRLTTSNATQMSRWLDACHQASLSRTNAWNLESLLIKPVQRLMKYPLLLKSLAECTADNHPDKAPLCRAALDMQGVADRTNEEKRRKDLEAAPGPADTTELRKGVTKGLVRSTERLKQTVGISEKNEVIDRSYDILVDRFRRRHMELRIVMESFHSCFQVSVSSIEKLYALACSFDEWVKLPIARFSASSSSGAMAYPGIEQQWRAFRRAMTDMQDHDLTLFRSAFVSHVIGPLEHVLDLFDRPLKAMTKRDRKVPDYRRYLSLRERGIAPDKTVVALAESYLALNGALVKEIPKFLNFVDQMVEAVLSNWVDVQSRWYLNCARRIREYCAHVRHQERVSIEDLETSFLLQFSSIDGLLKPVGICNGDLHHLLQALDADLNMQRVNSTTTLTSVSSPSLLSGAFGSRSGNSTPKLISSEFAHYTPPLSSQSKARSASSSSNVSQTRLPPNLPTLHHTRPSSTVRSVDASKKRIALTSTSTASLISSTHKSRHGHNH